MTDNEHAGSKMSTLGKQLSDLEAANTRLLNIITNNTDGMLVVSQDGDVVFANPAAEKMLNRSGEMLLGQNFGFPILADEAFELDLVRLDKKPTHVEMRAVDMSWEENPSFLISLHDVTEYRQLQEELQQKHEEKIHLLSSIPDILYSLELDADNNIFTIHYFSPVCEKFTGQPSAYFQENYQHWFDLIWPEDQQKLSGFGFPENPGAPDTVVHEYRITGKNDQCFWMRDKINTYPLPNGHLLLDGVISDITSQKQREQEMQSIITLSEMLREAHTSDEMFPIIINHFWKSLQVDGAAIAIHSPDTKGTTIKLGFGVWADWEECQAIRISDKPDQLLFKEEPYTKDQIEANLFDLSGFELGNINAISVMPLRTQEKTFGTLLIGRHERFTESEIRIFWAASNIAANAIHRADLLQQTEKRMDRLLALRAIDVAITSSMDLQITLNVCLEHVIAELAVDAACILLLDQDTQMLEFGAGYGFNTRKLAEKRLPLSQDRLGNATLERKPILTSNIHEAQIELSSMDLFKREGFVGYYYIPLISKGAVKGALEVFQRKPINPSNEWLEFADALASQAAIAVDNATLFNELQRFSIELMLSYDATIEGWARAVAFRDSDTEGHSRRVTEMTLNLARILRVPESEIADIRRGAILHDIGKLAIPDAILRKPGPLDEEEWQVMRTHPQIAYDLLAQVPFLRSALEIPLYHHEYWNGKGYPKGLKGTQIPFYARIFAVADVWDALTSDRSYRKAWTNEKSREYIESMSGIQFDPAVVEAFIKLMDANNTPASKERFKPNILVVDDEENIVQSLQRALRNQYNVYIADSGDAALEILTENDIAVVLTDQRMPGLTGLQLLKKAQTIRPEVVGVLISGYSDPEVLANALNMGNVRGFISKPWDLEDLKRRLEDVIAYQNAGIHNSIDTSTVKGDRTDE